MKAFLRAGALAGLAGGAALAVFLKTVGEVPIRRAIAAEPAAATGGELFGRGVQEVGGMAGAVLYGLLLGTVLAVVLAAVRHRLAARDDWHRAVALAGVAFVTVALVPALKYPANPPGVGDPDTVGARTGLFVLMLLWSVTATWAAWRLNLSLRERRSPDHVRLPATVALHVAVVAAGLLVLPAAEPAGAAQADVVWALRLQSLAGAALLWAVTGTVLGWLLLGTGRRTLPREPVPRP